MHATCPRIRDTERLRAVRRGTRDALFQGMKPVLLLAFLALGPALADQSPLMTPAASTTEAVAAVDCAASAHLAGPDADQARTILCRR